jgi:hypothetical protein
MIVTAIEIHMSRNETEQTTAEQANVSRKKRWPWKREFKNRKKRREEDVELEAAVEAGRTDCVSHWFENGSIRSKKCRPGNKRTWTWSKIQHDRICSDFLEEQSICTDRATKPCKDCRSSRESLW